MVSLPELGQAGLLSTLTAPIDRKTGCTFASSVTALHRLSKRRRTEIATAADGVSVDIHNVQSSSIVSSYSFSPQSRFLIAPCSVFRKHGKTGPSRRFTYACVKPNSEQDSNPLVVGYAENVLRTVSAEPDHFVVTVAEPTVPAVLLETVATLDSAENEDHSVVLVRADGSVNLFSSDLSSSVTVSEIKNYHQKSAFPISKVIHATLFDASKAQRGLLKNRDDLLSRLYHNDSLAGVQVLAVVMSSSNATHLHLLGLLPQPFSGAGHSASSSVYLEHWRLPLSPQIMENPVDWIIDPLTGKLFVQSPSQVVTINLSTIVPRVITTLPLPQSDVASAMYLGSNAIVFSSPTSNFVYDLQYSSVLAVGMSDEPASAESSSRKRKRADPPSSAQPLRFVAYYSKIQSVVGIWKGHLASLSLSSLNLPSATSTGLGLVDSLGKGARRSLRFRRQLKLDGVSTLRRCYIESNMDEEWVAKQAEFEALIAAGNAAEFEAGFASAVGMKILRDDADASGAVTAANGDVDVDDIEVDGDANGGDAVADEDADAVDTSPTEQGCMFLDPNRWNYHKKTAIQLLRPYSEKAAFAIQTLFETTVDQEGQAKLKIKNLFHGVFRWLAITGHLGPTNIQVALHQKGKLRAVEVSPGQLIGALVDYDPTMRLLFDYLHLQNHFDVRTLMQVIKTIIRSFDTDATSPSDSAVFAPPKDGDASHEEEQAALDLDRAMTTLEHGTFIRGQSLRQALTKLHTFPLSAVTKQMRADLSIHEIIFLIQILRIELIDGGWTARYFCEMAYQTPKDVVDEAITLISDLITCAVDAVGIAGWLGEVSPLDDGEDESEAESLLASLQSQIAVTVDGLHETTFVKGILDGFLKYNIDESSLSRKEKWSMPKRSSKSTVAPILDWDEKTDESALLPLGCKVEGSSQFRPLQSRPANFLSSDGRRNVTSRLRGNEISRRVGKYSRELIRF